MKVFRNLFLYISLALAASGARAQSVPRARDLRPLCDSLSVLMQERTSVQQKLSVSRIVRSGKALDLHFSAELAYYPWREDDIRWFSDRLRGLWTDYSNGFALGRIFAGRYALGELVVPLPGNSGRAVEYRYASEDPRSGLQRGRFINEIGARRFPEGLDDRYIALWQSHGRYYDEDRDEWLWQRACVHRSVEDMLTQTFVLPYLIPMLENAGAYVLTPRERDTQRLEYIIDNDPAFDAPRTGETRRSGLYTEKGLWQDAGKGFADFRQSYTFDDNPFAAGTARKAVCAPGKGDASIIWTPGIESRGRYAVYISYKTLPESSEAAHYTVRHASGSTEFTVNQKRGGGTWIYLGSFDFEQGSSGCIILDNRGDPGTAVTADAVKIGGGMGKVERGGRTSAMASSAEGAHYWMQWAGVPKDITRNWDTDYTNDFASRGAWAVWMREDKQIPFDLALAFHTDAGVTPNDSTVGTLAIYTLRCDGEREFADGRDRILSRTLCDNVQSQIVDDVRADFDPEWSRRGIWDKSYSECRTAGVPAMILELLSHQNFADMKYGLDPSFRFTVGRAVYKGILKTLSEFYGCPYTVQPLPVAAFSARLSEDGTKVRLEWQPRRDPREPTAVPDSYIVCTRRGDGAFDRGIEVRGTNLEMEIEPGVLHSYKVIALNSGGRSFPSEILSVGVPVRPSASRVLIVNNFTRVSAPAWIDSPTYAGFDSRYDSGVPYICDIGYIGESYEFDRTAEYRDNDYSGFGSSYDDHAGECIAGNTFDYPALHGASLLALGYSFCSVSSEAFIKDGMKGERMIDLICGKQGRTLIGRGAVGLRYPVFPAPLRKALDAAAASGTHILLSGSNIASDLNAEEAKWAEKLFGYRCATPNGTNTGFISGMPFSSTLNPDIYCIERPDGLNPAGKMSKIWLRYPRSAFGAAVYCNGAHSKSVSIGVPVETLLDEQDRRAVLKAVLDYFERSGGPRLRHAGQ